MGALELVEDKLYGSQVGQSIAYKILNSIWMITRKAANKFYAKKRLDKRHKSIL